MNTIVENVKRNMKDRNITERYISLMTGWSIEKVNDILNGFGDPNVSDVEFMTTALGCDIPEYEQRCDTETVLNIKNINNDDKVTADKLLEMLRFYDAIINPGL